MFWVHGGVHTDLTFQKIIPETEEFYGPFITRQEAQDCWRKYTWLKVDTCPHRLFIVDSKPKNMEEINA